MVREATGSPAPSRVAEMLQGISDLPTISPVYNRLEEVLHDAEDMDDAFFVDIVCLSIKNSAHCSMVIEGEE